MEYFHLAFSITQECPFLCDICLRYHKLNSRKLNPAEWREMINTLKSVGLKRITITGGEPSILGRKLFDFIKFLHQEQIHTSLSTTGFRLDETLIREMDYYLDHLLISIRSLKLEDWTIDFGNTHFTQELFETVKNLLKWVKATGIILEVNTVVHRENKKTILGLGQKLLEINPNIVWRIDNYYANGLTINSRDRFELSDQEFDEVCHSVHENFVGKFRDIRFITKTLKITAPGYLLVENGDLVLTSDHTHRVTEYNVLKNKLPIQFPMPRSWHDYKVISRDWGWKTFL
jgi:MoaA/NifB/PqqE/SkfB family radical SAM enzyme